MKARLSLILLLASTASLGQDPDRFRSSFMDGWPSPSEVRLATGAPGPAYWQQKVDYDIHVTLDEPARRIMGDEVVAYHNRSPDTLDHLWIAVDQNRFRSDSKAEMGRPSEPGALSKLAYDRSQFYAAYDGSLNLQSVTDGRGRSLSSARSDTFMRVDLKEPLKPGQTAQIKMRWSYNLVDEARTGNQRTGYTCLDKSGPGSCIYQVGQWFPRVAAYSDYKGWHLNPFLGFGSFALEMGDYHVAITVPKGQIVSSTGRLVNEGEVLTDQQRRRLAAARQSSEPIEIVTAAEAAAQRSNVPTAGSATWKFEAQNVRDFTWASSRAFRWDAASLQLATNRPLLMAFYPQEGGALWRPMAIPLMRHALERGSRNLYDYPYPVFQAVNGSVLGFEYPMLAFVGNGRSSSAGQGYSAAEVDDFAAVLLHETSHSWFPITVNSDEREWSWLDEGLNSYLQYHAEISWRKGFIAPVGRGDPAEIGTFMIAPHQRMPMDRPDSLISAGYEGYGKVATALNVLREVVVGPDRFDRALREYAQRWRFKRPNAFDFFRSFNDSTGEDLDWFWRAWFFGTGHVDIALKGVTRLALESRKPEPVQPDHHLAHVEGKTVEESDPAVAAIYENAVANPVTAPAAAVNGGGKETDLYRFDFEDKGGVPSPIPLRIEMANGQVDTLIIPAEIWRRSLGPVSWIYHAKGAVSRVEVDPQHLTGDSDTSNNALAVAN